MVTDLETQGQWKQVGEISKQLIQKISDPGADIAYRVVHLTTRACRRKPRIGRRVADQCDEQKKATARKLRIRVPSRTMRCVNELNCCSLSTFLFDLFFKRFKYLQIDIASNSRFQRAL